MSNPNGSFTKIVEQSGDIEAQKLKKEILSKVLPPKSNESGLHVMFKEDPNHVSRHANKLSQSSNTSNRPPKQESAPMPKSLESVFFNIKNNSETIKNTASSSSSGGGYTNLLSLYTNPKEEEKETKPKTQEEIERDITNRRSDDFLRDNNIYIE